MISASNLFIFFYKTPPQITTMANNDLSSRLRYLKDSAQMMSSTSPATSAYLMSQVNQLMFDHEIEPSELHRRYACGACGSIMVPGWTSSLEKEVIQTKPRRRKSKAVYLRPEKDKAENNTGITSMLYRCNLCGKNTRHRQPNHSIPAYRRGKKLAQSVQLASPVATAEKQSSGSANTNSKKRARARKQGGLQALLAAKKENGTSNTGFGLDLMDLMKKA